MAQRDPLIEYQREGYDLFVAMMDAIKEETVGFIFNVEVQVEAPAEIDVVAVADGEGDAVVVAQEQRHAPVISAPGLTPSRPQHLEYTAPSADGGIEHGEMESTADGLIEVDPNASRAERRRAERENRKRKQ